MTDDLVLGAVLTASEMEGVADTAEWARWIGQGNAPPSLDGAGFRTTWRDDLELLAELGISEMLVTLEWARLRPGNSDSAAPSESEVEFRRDLLTAIAELGVRPWACLVDGSLPGWFVDDERGFTDDRSRRLLWPRHVDWIGETFGDLVAGWVPMREPRQWAAWGQLVGATPPGSRRRRDMQRLVVAFDEAELEAERLLRGSAPVATYVTSRAVIGASDDVKARPHARWLEQHLGSEWLMALAEGRARDAFSRIVAQLRPPIVVDGDGAWSPPRSPVAIEGMLDPLEAVVDAAGDREVIAAGDCSIIAAGEASDDRTDHLATLIAGATELGAAGWWQTSPIDGWQWQRGFRHTPGLFDRDRTRRPAADALIQVRA